MKTTEEIKYRIKSDESTGWFGIVAEASPEIWLLHPRYAKIETIPPPLAGAGLLFQLYRPGKDGGGYDQIYEGVFDIKRNKFLLDSGYKVLYTTIANPSMENFIRHAFLIQISRLNEDQDKVGLFDTASEGWLIPCEYDHLEQFPLNPNLVKTEKWSDEFRFTTSGLIDNRNGQMLLDCRYSIQNRILIRYGYEPENYPGQVAIKDLFTSKWGVMDTNGQLLLPVENDLMDAGYLGEKNDDNVTYYYQYRNPSGKVGLVNQQFEILVPFDYDDLRVYPKIYKRCYDKTHFLAAKRGQKWGAIDFANNELVPFQYDDLFFDDRSLHPPKIDETYLLNVTQNGRMGMVTTQCVPVLPLDYDWIGDFEHITRHQVFRVSKNDKQGVVDINNSVLIPIENDFIRLIKVNAIEIQNLYEFQVNGLWGLCDTDQNIHIPPVFDQITAVYQTAEQSYEIQVAKGGKAGIVNEKNEVLVAPSYKAIWQGSSSNGLVGVLKGSKYGIVNTNGEVVVPFEYHSISKITSGETDYVHLKMDKASPGLLIEISEILALSPSALKQKVAEQKEMRAPTPEFALQPGDQMVYKVGNFDALDSYKILLQELRPDLIFTWITGQSREISGRAVFKGEAIREAIILHEINDANFDGIEKECPSFRISDRMYNDLTTTGQCLLAGIFGLPKEPAEAIIQLRKRQKKKVKINGEKVEINSIECEIYCSKGNEKVKYGSVSIRDNQSFPLIIKLDLFGGQCNIELAEILI